LMGGREGGRQSEKVVVSELREEGRNGDRKVEGHGVYLNKFSSVPMKPELRVSVIITSYTDAAQRNSA
jgi:hypothetical protein